MTQPVASKILYIVARLLVVAILVNYQDFTCTYTVVKMHFSAGKRGKLKGERAIKFCDNTLITIAIIVDCPASLTKEYTKLLSYYIP